MSAVHRITRTGLGADRGNSPILTIGLQSLNAHQVFEGRFMACLRHAKPVPNNMGRNCLDTKQRRALLRVIIGMITHLHHVFEGTPPPLSLNSINMESDDVPMCMATYRRVRKELRLDFLISLWRPNDEIIYYQMFWDTVEPLARLLKTIPPVLKQERESMLFAMLDLMPEAIALRVPANVGRHVDVMNDSNIPSTMTHTSSPLNKNLLVGHSSFSKFLLERLWIGMTVMEYIHGHAKKIACFEKLLQDDGISIESKIIYCMLEDCTYTWDWNYLFKMKQSVADFVKG